MHGLAPIGRLVSSLLVVVSAAAPLAAQDREPYQGLFGGYSTNPASRQQLDADVAVVGGYDDNVLAAGESGAGNPALQQPGYFGGLTGRLTYARQFRRSDFGATLGSSLRYYPDLADLSANTTFAALSYGVALGQRSNVRLLQSASYSPNYRLRLISTGSVVDPIFSDDLDQPIDASIPIDDDLAVSSRETLLLRSGVQFDRRLTRLTTFHASYGYRTADFGTGEAAENVDWHEAGAAVTRRLSEYSSAHAGYSFRTGRFIGGDDSPVGTHNFNAGVTYNRAFTIAPRTTVGFSTGSTVLSRDSPGADRGRDYYFRLLVNGDLVREFARSWRAQVAYRRGVAYNEGFEEPIFADTVSAAIGGYWGRRTNASLTSSYSNGKLGFSTNRAYDTWVSAARLQYAVTRNAAAFVQYLYYTYDFDQSVTLPEGVAPMLERQGVRAGLSFWVPLLR